MTCQIAVAAPKQGRDDVQTGGECRATCQIAVTGAIRGQGRRTAWRWSWRVTFQTAVAVK